MEDDGPPLDGRDEDKTREHGKISLAGVGMGRGGRAKGRRDDVIENVMGDASMADVDRLRLGPSTEDTLFWTT